MDDFEACLTTTSTSSLSQAEFNQVVNYINRIKQRFALDPDTYEQFCEIFQAYHEEQRPVAEVHRRVSVLFNEHRDLLEDFHYFLPGGGTDTNDEDGVMGSVEADSSSELSGTTTGITCSPVPAGTPAPSSPSNRALNVKDALSYLEMVKVEFQDKPGVYSQFLDIMKYFKNDTIDTSEVVNRVCRLFDGHTALIEGFDVFLPQGYRIDCTVGQHDHNLITVTTPFGQITQITGGSPRHITSTRASPALLELPLLFGFDEPCPPLPPRPPSPFSYFDSSPATAPPVAALQTWQPMLSPYPAPSSTLALSHVDPSLDEKDHLMSTHNRVVNHLDRGQSEIFNNQPEQTEVNLSWSVISGGTPLFSVISLLVQHGCQDITDELDIPSCSKYPISTGGSGDIYRGRLREGLTVAIKCMRILADPAVGKQQKHLKDAAREINTWSKLEHRYISKLLGLALFRDQIAMLSPWAERRSLPAYLAGNSDLNRLLLCTRIAEGLEFLHERGIVHGDLKGSNILISDAGEPLLSDFGNAILQERTLEFTDTTTKRSISLRWTAPELLSQCQYSPQADVYALGMTILEVVTGAIPYVGIKDISVITAIVSGRLPARPEHIPAASKDGNTLWMLLNHCWAFSPGSRPTASEVKEVVAKITPEGLTYCRENERKRYASSGNLEDGATTRKRVKPDRAMKVVQELLLTEGKHLKTLEHIQTDYCQAAPPDLVEHLQFMVEISRTFIEHLSSDLSVQGACDAFLVVEERLETAFVRWSISVSKAAAWIHGHEGNSLIDWLSAIVPSERAFRLVVSYQQIELNVPSTSVLRPLTERALQVAKRIAERCNEAERDADDPLT